MIQRAQQNQCVYCYRGFATQGILKRHKREFCRVNPESDSFKSTKHQFVCPQCNSSFKNKYHLDEHLRLDCGKRQTCEQCGRTFRYSRSLKHHLKRSCSVKKNHDKQEFTEMIDVKVEYGESTQ